SRGQQLPSTCRRPTTATGRPRAKPSGSLDGGAASCRKRARRREIPVLIAPAATMQPAATNATTPIDCALRKRSILASLLRMPSGADLRQLAQEARRKSVPPATPGALPCEPSARICPPAQRCGAQPDVETLLVAYELGGWIEALGLDTLAGPS